MENLEALLAEQPFLKGLSEAHIKLFSDCARDVTFEAGQTIIKQGDPAEKFYLIRHGRVAVQIYAEGKGALTIETLQEGDVLGWSWIVAPHNWRFDAKAMVLTRAVGFDARCVRDKCEKNHDVGYELMKRFTNVIAERLEATRFQLLDVYGQHVRSR